MIQPQSIDLPLSLQLEHQPSFIKSGYFFTTQYTNVRSQSFTLRYTVSELLKYNGNSLYKSGEYLQASEEYEKSLSIFRYIRKKPRVFKKSFEEELEFIEEKGASINEKNKILALKLGLYLNLSLCYLIMSRCFNALRAAQEALKLEPYNTKALYRSAKAKIMNKDSSFHELISAKNELELALKQQSDDQMIKQELNKLNEELDKSQRNNHLKNEEEEIIVEKKKERLPKDIEELEDVVSTKGQDIIKLYENLGKRKEAEEFRNEIKAAMVKGFMVRFIEWLFRKRKIRLRRLR